MLLIIPGGPQDAGVSLSFRDISPTATIPLGNSRSTFDCEPETKAWQKYYSGFRPAVITTPAGKLWAWGHFDALGENVFEGSASGSVSYRFGFGCACG